MRRIKRIFARYFYVFDESYIKWLLVLCAFIFTAMLDVFGIGALGLFIQSIIAPEGLERLTFLPDSLKPSSAESLENSIVAIGLLSFLFFALRTLFSYCLQVFMIWFNTRKQIQLQSRLFHCYLHAPLLFRKKRSFSKMLYSVNFLTNQFIFSFSNNLFNLASNLVLFAVIVLFLAKTHLLASIVVSVLFGIAALLYFLLIKNRSSIYGKMLARATEKQFKNVREGIGALDEIQILGCQDFFESKVRQNLETSVKYRLKTMILNLIPRPMAEFILLSFIILFALGYQKFIGDITQISAIVGIFGLAGMRLVPAASHISASINGLKNSSYSVHEIYDEIQALREEEINFGEETETQGRLSFNHAIRLENVSYAYPDEGTPVLENLSLEFLKGQQTAIVGKSGSGKTTLMNILLGNIAPVSGQVTVDGQSISGSLPDWRKKIFYLPQTIYILDDTITRNIALGIPDEQIDKDRCRWAIEQAQLKDLVDSLGKGTETMLGDQGTRLSGGQRQRIGIARALYHHREILVMDEATSALDEETEKDIMDSLNNLPEYITVIMITHHLDEENTFDQIIRLSA
jgi:ABC-type bacteriocin/lantibiotic exporter with double-glycine peptidase domain